ncbi:MAG: phage portal protein [Chloroflexi bacterium]|nr:phage portal protein [Chloroflexota bacterium]
MQDDAALVARLATLDRERMRGYRELLEFYRGQQWREVGRRGERRLTLNYAKVLVEKVTSYLMTDRLMVVDPEDERPESLEAARRAEAALARISEANDLEALDFDTEIDTAVLGDGAYKVTWDVEAAEVRITAPDVQGIWLWPRADDPTQPAKLAHQYPLADGTGTAVEVWTATTFALFIDGKPARRGPNPYGFLPYVVFPNLRAPKQLLGVSDLVPILEPARELNRAMTQLSRLLELSGNPIAVLENVDRADEITVGPGAVWELPERARAYILDLLGNGGVGLHIDYLNALYRALHDLAETPRTAFGDTSRALTGVALEIELQPLLQKVARKRLLRSAVYRRRNAMALRLLERFGGDRFAPYRTRVVWGPITPKDGSRQLAEERAAVASGLRSRRGAMVRLGTADPEREFTRWLEEEEARQRVAGGRKGEPDGRA